MNISYMAIPAIKRGERSVNVDRIIDVVINITGISFPKMRERCKKRPICEARMICMYLLKEHTTTTLTDIGRYFGGRDHTTAIHAVKTIRDLLGNEPRIQSLVKQLEERL